MAGIGFQIAQLVVSIRTRDRRRERAFTTREVGRVADVYAPAVPAARPGEPAPTPRRTEA